MSPDARAFSAAGCALGLSLIVALYSLSVAAGGDGSPATRAKIRFDLSVLDSAGLYGPPDGLRALAYEFCIPDNPEAIDRVRHIDGSLRLQKAPGRAGCSSSELLCIGSTHQTGFREVLAALARLPFVVRIEQAFFE